MKPLIAIVVISAASLLIDQTVLAQRGGAAPAAVPGGGVPAGQATTQGGGWRIARVRSTRQFGNRNKLGDTTFGSRCSSWSSNQSAIRGKLAGDDDQQWFRSHEGSKPHNRHRIWISSRCLRRGWHPCCHSRDRSLGRWSQPNTRKCGSGEWIWTGEFSSERRTKRTGPRGEFTPPRRFAKW